MVLKILRYATAEFLKATRATSLDSPCGKVAARAMLSVMLKIIFHPLACVFMHESLSKIGWNEAKL